MVSDESDSTSRAINESARRSGSPEGVQEDRLEKEMICRAEFGERIVLVGHNPEPVVFGQQGNTLTTSSQMTGVITREKQWTASCRTDTQSDMRDKC